MSDTADQGTARLRPISECCTVALTVAVNAAERWRELLEDVLQDIGEALTSEAIVEAREALVDERRRRDDSTPTAR